MKRFAVAFVLLTAVQVSSAQAQTYQPYQPYQAGVTRNYQQDLAECQSYANQVNPVQDAAIGAFGGAAMGAGLGALTGAAFKGVSVGEGAAIGAISGGVLGLAGGAYTGHQNQQDVLNNCMRGRGYSTY